MFGMQDHTFDGLDTVLLTTVSDNFELGLIQELLKDHGIPFLLKDRESGDYMRILGGFSIFGTDIHVHKSDYETAKGLVDAYVTCADAAPPEEDQQA